MRNLLFADGEIYHIYNRGVEKRPTFTDKREYERAILSLMYYSFESPSLRLSKALLLNADEKRRFFQKLKEKSKITEILAYCLMANHYHLLVRQTKKNGIRKLLTYFGNSYSKYFNTKHKRSGALFQGIFKAVHIEDDEQLTHVSRYIHLNPVSSFIVSEKRLEDYPWSSFPQYTGKVSDGLCNIHIVLDLFSSKNAYKKFVLDQADYAKTLETIKHLSFD